MKKEMNKAFQLNYENLKALCDRFLKGNKLFSIKIDHSCNKTSNSFYLRFFYCGDTTSLRVSDHNTKLTEIGGGIRNLVIDGSVRTYAVYTKICETARDLRHKNQRLKIDRLFEEIRSKK